MRKISIQNRFLKHEDILHLKYCLIRVVMLSYKSSCNILISYLIMVTCCKLLFYKYCLPNRNHLYILPSGRDKEITRKPTTDDMVLLNANFRLSKVFNLRDTLYWINKCHHINQCYKFLNRFSEYILKSATVQETNLVTLHQEDKGFQIVCYQWIVFALLINIISYLYITILSSKMIKIYLYL